MLKDDARLDESIAAAADISRRTVTRGMAWSVPVIVGAVAAPMQTSSPSTPPPVVTFTGGSGVRGGTTNRRNVEFILKLNSDQATTVTLVSLLPDDSWRALAGEAWPNRVLSLGAGANTFKFTLDRTGNEKATYEFSYSVPGVGRLAKAPVTLT